MRPKDKPLFSQVAKNLNAWILVRHTNAASLQYVGMSGYVPKPIHCKAKTADIATHPLVGLVVDPTTEPQAFSDKRLPEALKSWEDFLPELRQPNSEFAVIRKPGSPDHAAVTWGGRKIHGDYDLKGVILVGHENRNLSAVETLNGQKHMRGPLFYAVQARINKGIGADMIQHSSEEGYADHADEPIDVFGPLGEVFTLAGETETKAFYDKMGRKTNDISRPQAGPVGQPKKFEPIVIQGGKR